MPRSRLKDEADGRLALTMNVCHDWALRSWILSWGPFAHVSAPPQLAAEISADLTAAAGQYAADASSSVPRSSGQRTAGSARSGQSTTARPSSAAPARRATGT